MVAVLGAVSDWLLSFFHRVDSCMCHADLHSSCRDVDHLAKLLHVWASCPMRGQMAPWFAAGDFMVLLEKLSETHSAQCVLALPQSLSSGETMRLLAEFDRARSHIFAFVVLKNWHWTQVPHLVFALGHHDKKKAHEAWHECVQSDSSHPRVVRLREPGMHIQGAAYFATGSTDAYHVFGRC